MRPPIYPRASIAMMLSASLLACSGSGGAPASYDAGDAGDAGGTGTGGSAPVDGGGDGGALGPLTPCDTTGKRAITAPGVSCFTLTPAESGAAATGENATVPSYALFPDSSANGKLVLYFNGSGGSPGGTVIASPTESFYTAATSLGYAVLAVSYYSTTSIGDLCAGGTTSAQDACFFPTRASIILGVAQPGANATVAAAMTVDQGIVGRVVLALEALAARDPAHAWGSFLKSGAGAPETRIDWSKVVSTGHSQGGGHAAAVGKLFGVTRVVQLSSVCDLAGTTPASWTLSTNGPWASDPSQFYGLAAPTIFTGGKPTGGDTTCPGHTLNWMNEGMIASHQDNAAATCGVTGDTHDESIQCADNYAAWRATLE